MCSKIFFSSKLRQKFLKIKFLKNISSTIVFLLPNMKLECLQLSFDIHIVHTSQKFRFFPSCSTKNWKIFPVRLIDFCSILQKKLQLIGCFSKTLLVNKDARFHMRPFLLHLDKVWRYVCKMCHFDNPLLYRSTKKPALIRVEKLKHSM